MFLLREIDANKNSLLPVDILTMILNSPLIIFCRLFLGEKKRGIGRFGPLNTMMIWIKTIRKKMNSTLLGCPWKLLTS